MTRGARLVALAVGLATTFLLAGAGCSPPDTSATVSPGALDKADFATVMPMLSRRCGSIACHGSRFRNLRFYGYGGTRLDSAHTPEAPPTTADEIDRNYEAVMGLEPEVMRAFLEGGRKDPSKLVLVRKARNQERHSGGLRLLPGDPADACLLTWLTAKVDANACSVAANERNPLDD